MIDSVSKPIDDCKFEFYDDEGKIKYGCAGECDGKCEPHAHFDGLSYHINCGCTKK